MARGPSYPYVGLEDAISLTRKMYDYAKRGAAPADAVVKDAWKYSPTSSSGQKVLAALKSFGLIEDVPDKSTASAIKLSQRAIHILLEDQDTPERRDEIKKAALAPKWYDYCWKTWGKEMPPSMRSNLLIQHGFVDSTVDSFLKEYRKTMAFAGLLDSVIFSDSGNGDSDEASTPKIGDFVQWESQGMLRMAEAKKLVRIESGFAFVEGSPTGIPVSEIIPAEGPEEKPPTLQNSFGHAFTKAAVQGGATTGFESFALSEGGFTLELTWPSVITEEGFDDFLYQLEGLKRKVSRAVRKDSPGSPLS